jgi:hypothetical protein
MTGKMDQVNILFKCVVFSAAFLFLSTVGAHAADVTLQWDANTESDLAGYNVYYRAGSSGAGVLANYNGTGAHEGDSPTDVPLSLDENPDPNTVEFTVHNLTDGETYYFVVTAYDDENPSLESEPSNEVYTSPVTDTSPPYTSNHSPASGETGVPVNSLITVEIRDDGVGVNLATIMMQVNGAQVSPSISGTSAAYTLSYDTSLDFGYQQSVSVAINASDLNGNSMATDSYSFTTTPAPDTTPPYIVPYPSIDFDNNTIDVTYSESNMLNAATEANYAFSPSLNFSTRLVEGDDITNPLGNTYRLSMFSIPKNTVFTLTMSSITDQAENSLDPDFITINDDDRDDMADDWEAYHGIDNLSGDPDSDGLNNFEEYRNNTDPNASDTDGDTLPDGWEVTYGLDPNNATGDQGASGDPDNDGFSNAEEYATSTDPNSDDSPTPTPPEIIRSVPLNNSGITNDKRIPNNTSFAVYLYDSDGIDITDATSISFAIDDSVNSPYTRDLNDNDVFRVVKLTSDADTQVTQLWAVYDRSLDTYGDFSYGIDVNIRVEAKDRRGAAMAQASFAFSIESLAEHEYAKTNAPETTIAVDSPSSGLTTTRIDAGDLAGAMIVYESNEPVPPVFGPTDEIPSLDTEGIAPLSTPLNFTPPTVFNTPVTVFIPVPDVENVSDLSVALYDGECWVIACDADGNVAPEAEGWMVAGSRVNHSNGDPSTIEIQVYHFSAVQAAGNATTQSVPDDAEEVVEDVVEASEEDSGAGCFIGAITSGFDGKTGILPFFLMSALTAVAYRLAARRQK